VNPASSRESEQVEADAAALRADLDYLQQVLGETLVRQVGPHLLALVEEVRELAASFQERPDQATARRLDEVLAGLDLDTTIALVRAFTAYFHLANVVEQVHRVDLLSGVGRRGTGWLETAVDRICRAALPSSEVEDVVRRLEVRPVLTAHPTEAVGWSILSKLAAIAGLLEQRRDPRANAVDVAEIDRRIREII